VREVNDNRGYATKSNAATMILQNKGTQHRQKTMFIHTNCEEAIELPMNHNGVSQLHVPPGT